MASSLNQPLIGSAKRSATIESVVSSNGSEGQTQPSGESAAPSHSKNQLRTLNGVYVPCCLNIMGIILFLRLGWGVSQAGVVGTLGIIAVAETMAILTVLSFSAIVTNGEMAGGGSYFMISRSLGPEFGGAMGMLFYVAYAMGVCFYIIGFATEIQSTFYPTATEGEAYWLRVGYGSVGLAFILLISYIGADAFAKFNTWFFLVQFLSIGIAFFSFTFAAEHDLATNHYVECFDYDDSTNMCNNGTLVSTVVTGWRMSNLRENLMPSFVDTQTGESADVNRMCNGGQCSVTLVFAVLFPMATGIMEGANLSGDLKDPARSIPKGTIYAVASAIVIYSVLVLSMGASFPRDTLLTNMNVMQEACFNRYVVVVGIIISSISSALGSLFGGSRVLQALARDNLYPCLSFFAKGTAHGDEPRRGVIFTWAFAQCCLFLGDLDVVAPLITSFFCMSYALCNLTAFVLSITGAPNFRPTWRFYSWQLSLLGFIMNLGVMFVLSWSQALIALVLLICLFGFVWWRHPSTDWGDVSQALMYHQVRKYLLRIDERKTHAKFWRPSVLLLCDDFNSLQVRSMINFGREIKKGGLMVLGNVVQGNIEEKDKKEALDRIHQGWLKYLGERGIKAFSQEIICPDTRLGYQFLMQGSGLGGLRCNTVLLPWFDPDDISLSNAGTRHRDMRTASFYNDVAAALQAASPRSDGSPSIDVEDPTSLNLGARAADTDLESGEPGATSDGSHRRVSNANSIASERMMALSGNLPLRSSTEYLSVISDALALRKNIIVGCNHSQRSARGQLWSTNGPSPGPPRSIDIWLTQEWDGSFGDSTSLTIQLGHILHRRKKWRKTTTLRLMVAIDSLSNEAAQEMEQRLRKHLKTMRITSKDIEVHAVSLCELDGAATLAVGGKEAASPGGADDVLARDGSDYNTLRRLNLTMKRHSAHAGHIFALLPSFASVTAPASARRYLNNLRVFTEDLAPTSLVMAGEMRAVITRDL